MPAIQEDIRILGGYHPGSWIRNPSAYTTELTRNAPAVLVYSSNGVSRASLLDGFTITNTAVGGSTVGVTVQTGAEPEIRNNGMSGGNGNDSRGLEIISSRPLIANNIISAGIAGLNATGVYLQSSSDTELLNNTINAGTGNFTRGLHVFNTGARIEGNDISGGIAVNTSYGAFLDSAAGTTFQNNRIVGGIGSITYGMYIWNMGPLTINGNSIFGTTGIATMETTGVYVFNAQNTFLTNNIIHAGRQATTSNSRGVYVRDGLDSVFLYNNTIFGGRTGTLYSIGIETSGTAAPHVVNNIIVAGTGVPAALTRGFWHSGPNKPTRFLNNLILSINPAAIPFTGIATDYMNESEIDLYLTGGVPDPNYRDYRVSTAENPFRLLCQLHTGF